MSFIGNRYSATQDNNFYNPEPKGVDASAWSKYPAEQTVDIDNNDIINVNNLTAQNIIATEKDVENLTVLNDLSVAGDTSLHAINALGNVSIDDGFLTVKNAVEDGLVNLSVFNTDEDAFPPDADQGSAINLGGTFIGANDRLTPFTQIIGAKESASNYSDGYIAVMVNRDTDRAFGGSPQLTEKLRINSNGQVGIGTNNPGYLLEVNGDGYVNGEFIAENDVVIQNGGLIVKDPTATVSAKIYCRNLAINGGNQDVFDTTTGTDLVALPRLSHSNQITLSADFTFNTTSVAVHKFIDFNSGAYTLTFNLPAFREQDDDPAITHRLLCANAGSGAIKFQSTVVSSGSGITASNIFYLRPKNSGSKVLVNSPYTYNFNDAFYLIEASTTGGSNGEWMISIM